MILQDMLRAGANPTDLVSKYKITVSRGRAFQSLHCFKYSDFSPFNEPVVQECRGVVLDASNNWEVVCRAFDKFFNLTERLAAPIDWSTATVMEKLDGSLMSMYWYEGAWRVASSSTPDGNGSAMSGKTFADLFWEIYNTEAFNLPEDKEQTYIFEMINPDAPIQVRYQKAGLTLLAVRNRNTGRFMSADQAVQDLWPDGGAPLAVKTYAFSSMEDVVKVAGYLKGLEAEGFVVVDGNWNRVKIKSPDYVALAHARGQFSKTALLGVVLKHETGEVLATHPVLQEEINRIELKIDLLINEIQKDWDRLKHIKDRKAFAAEALKSPFYGALFLLQSGQAASVEDWLHSTYKTQPALLVEKLDL